MGIKDTNFDSFPSETIRPAEPDFNRTDSEIAFSKVVEYLRRMSDLNERIQDMTGEFKNVYTAYLEAMAEAKHGVNVFAADSERLYAKVLGQRKQDSD